MAPDAKMPAITVAAAAIRRDGRYLLCQRPAHKRHVGLWEFPGGKGPHRANDSGGRVARAVSSAV